MSSREQRTSLPHGWTLVRHANFWGRSPGWVAMKICPDGSHDGHTGVFARRRDAIDAYCAALKVKA